LGFEAAAAALLLGPHLSSFIYAAISTSPHHPINGWVVLLVCPPMHALHCL
jgi:hypothetical protein